MKRTAIIAAAVLSLSACATSSASDAHYSVVPDVQVQVKGEKRKTSQANYQVRPEPCGCCSGRTW
jgi:hypothetical protein